MEKKKNNWLGLVIIILWIAFSISPIVGGICVVAAVIFFIKKKPKDFSISFSDLIKSKTSILTNVGVNGKMNIGQTLPKITTVVETPALLSAPPTRLERRKKYLQIALNSQTIEEAMDIARLLPISERILIEAGTPLIKRYGTKIVRNLKYISPNSYIVADTKCADLAQREVEMMANAGANAVTCLGVAPIETIDIFISECKKNNVDSMIDMMNVESPLSILKKLQQLPDVVILHRGVDESEFSKEKQIPFYQIKQIKGNYNKLVSVAGGDSINEVRRAIFNDADIVVIWKDFYQLNQNTADLAAEFLKEIK